MLFANRRRAAVAGISFCIALLGESPKPPQAHLIAPYAVAVDPSDVAYVADPGAQRIFERASGMLVDLAGSGDPDAAGLVPGGFRNGPAATARFDRPLGIALAADGSVLVSDSENHCIRRVSHGIVTTYAGSSDGAGNTDGTLATARFERPMAIANDGGTLYVADYGAGIRKIAGGQVTTLKLDGMNGARSVAAFSHGGATTLFVGVEGGGLFKYDLATGARVGYGPSALLETSMGMPGQMVAINDHTAIFADPASRTIRSFWAVTGSPGFDGDYSQPLPQLALREDESDHPFSGGSDGPGAPRLVGPTGVAVRPNGALLVADPAAGRIVDMAAPDLRQPVSGNVNDLSLDGKKYYRIALISNSYVFTNVSYAQSIGATLEADLNRNRASSGPSKPARVLTVRISAVSMSNEANYIDTFLSGSVDLVVWMFNDVHVFTEVAKPAQNGVKPARAETIATTMRQLAESLKSNDTRFFVAYQPGADEASILEDRFGRDKTTIRFERGAIEPEVLEALKNSGVPFANLATQMVADEMRGDRRANFGTFNAHLSIRGNAVVGHAIARELDARAPWQR